MIDLYLYDQTPILPSGFRFPQSYLELVKSENIPKMAYWKYLCFDKLSALAYYGDVGLRYPNRSLVPFAIHADETGGYNEGFVELAMFDGEDCSGNPQVFIKDYAQPVTPPWQIAFADFDTWLSKMTEQAI